MSEIIRLVCPECDAVHRVKSITLGKLYRCKKCKSGLITMSPAVLACPSCGGTTPPAHIEVSRLITCEQCEQAPLMTVRFANIGTRQRSIHNLQSVEQASVASNSSEVTDDEILLPNDNESTEEPQSSTQEPEEIPVFTPPPRKSNVKEQSVLSDSKAQELSESDAYQPPANFSDESAMLPDETFNDDKLLPPEMNDQQEDTGVYEASEEDERVIAVRSAGNTDTTAPQQKTTKPNHDTAILVSKRDFSQQALFKQEALYQESDTEIGLTSSEVAEEDLIQPLHQEPPAYREKPQHDDFYAYNNEQAVGLSTDELRAVVNQVQEPLLAEIERGRWRIPLWIPVALAMLLIGLYGWLLGEMDSLREDIRIISDKEAEKEDVILRQSAEFSAERHKFLKLIEEKEKEKKQLENDLTEVMLKNEMLRKSMLGLPGPELGQNDG